MLIHRAGKMHMNAHGLIKPMHKYYYTRRYDKRRHEGNRDKINEYINANKQQIFYKYHNSLLGGHQRKNY